MHCHKDFPCKSDFYTKFNNTIENSLLALDQYNYIVHIVTNSNIQIQHVSSVGN